MRNANSNVFEHGHSQEFGEQAQPIAAQWLETGHCEWPEMVPEERQRVHLPGTQFNLKSYWIAPDIAPQTLDTAMDITIEPAPTGDDENRISVRILIPSTVSVNWQQIPYRGQRCRAIDWWGSMRMGQVAIMPSC
ncbi:hypothetical protein HC752_22265 [Vibrio sp. S9_S30]|uniref:hypothetical protein n=1 Tax=Vibrio sp. S9_S30 TaxID=2720226 RepID=UPI0016817D30|nr:hypothetical protein [Vibrio sp. S9_S30]MBD1559671.1 hypothetical protein [Vibrio sp. S9_S30]